MNLNFGSLHKAYKEGLAIKSEFGGLVNTVETLKNDFSSIESVLAREERLSSVVGKFKSNVGDVARSNLFLFEIPRLPNFLENENGKKSLIDMGIDIKFLKEDYFTFLCKSANLPAKNLNITKIRYSGLQVSFPGSMNYDSITIRFILDANCTILKFFDNYLSHISGRHGNMMTGMEYLDDIQTNLYIYKIDRASRKVYLSILEGAFPYSIGEVMNDNDTEGVNTIDVKFAYVGEKTSYKVKEDRSVLGRVRGGITQATAGINNFKISDII